MQWKPAPGGMRHHRSDNGRDGEEPSDHERVTGLTVDRYDPASRAGGGCHACADSSGCRDGERATARIGWLIHRRGDASAPGESFEWRAGLRPGSDVVDVRLGGRCLVGAQA
jgi:hypothetical protein